MTNYLAVGKAICNTSVWQSTPQAVFEPGIFRIQAMRRIHVVLMSPGNSSVSGLAVFFSNQSTFLQPYNVRNMNYLRLTAVIFFSFSSLPSPAPFHQILLSSYSHRHQTSIQSVQVSLHPAVKRPERAARHVPESSAEVKNKWSSTSTSLRAFKAWKGTV